VGRYKYTTDQLWIFVLALITGASIQAAYQQATHTRNPRHAYRWLDSLMAKLIEYRTLLKRRTATLIAALTRRSQRLQLLLPTLQSLFALLGQQPCAQFQLHQQHRFM